MRPSSQKHRDSSSSPCYISPRTIYRPMQRPTRLVDARQGKQQVVRDGQRLPHDTSAPCFFCRTSLRVFLLLSFQSQVVVVAGLIVLAAVTAPMHPLPRCVAPHTSGSAGHEALGTPNPVHGWAKKAARVGTRGASCFRFFQHRRISWNTACDVGVVDRTYQITLLGKWGGCGDASSDLLLLQWTHICVELVGKGRCRRASCSQHLRQEGGETLRRVHVIWSVTILHLFCHPCVQNIVSDARHNCW